MSRILYGGSKGRKQLKRIKLLFDETLDLTYTAHSIADRTVHIVNSVSSNGSARGSQVGFDMGNTGNGYTSNGNDGTTHICLS